MPSWSTSRVSTDFSTGVVVSAFLGIGSPRLLGRALIARAPDDHRVAGTGAHDGGTRPNRRRVGTMLGRDVVGKQFWAVPSGEQDQQLLVLDLHEGEFSRAVVATDAPPEIAYKTFHRTDPYAHRAGADDRRIAAARAPEIRESRSAGDGRDARYRGTRDGNRGPFGQALPPAELAASGPPTWVDKHRLST